MSFLRIALYLTKQLLSFKCIQKTSKKILEISCICDQKDYTKKQTNAKVNVHKNRCEKTETIFI